MNKKILITSGCSFTQGPYSWPESLGSLLNLQVHNYGQVSRGNDYISRSIIYNVTESLKNYSSNELLVGMMWSGPNRHEFFSPDISETLIHNSSYNPYGFIAGQDKNWVGVNSHWDDDFSQTYYKYFHDDIFSYIKTLENILRVQWFLNELSIDYFMSTYTDIVLPRDKILENKELKYLYEMIDFSKFVNVKSCIDWCIDESDIPMTHESKNRERFEMHPLPEHHKKFAEKVLVPFIEKNIYPCKEGERR